MHILVKTATAGVPVYYENLYMHAVDYSKKACTAEKLQHNTAISAFLAVTYIETHAFGNMFYFWLLIGLPCFDGESKRLPLLPDKY